jgi:lipopolysaccharide export system protein LptC
MTTTPTPSGPILHAGVRASHAAPRRQRARLSRFVTASVRRRRHSAFYSRFVTLMKVVLPATAVALASLVLFWPQLNPLDNRFRLKPVQVSIDDLENLRMVSPRFVGTDARNQPFAITADQATQEAGASDVTALANPKGDLTLNNGSWIALAALEGQYHKGTQILDLWDEVNVFHDAGYEIKTRRAKADLAKGDVFGDDAVEGQGPDSQLRGQGFRIYEKGARIAITGKSRLVLYPTPPEKK